MMTTHFHNTTSSESELGLHGVNIFGFTFLGLLIILTSSGNIIICVAILRNRRLLTSSNLLVVNMAIGDILYSISTLPLSMVFLSFGGSKWPLGRAGNVAFDAVWFSFFVLSFLNIQMIALNRFIAITKPYTYITSATKRRTVILCVCIWVYVAALSFGISFVFRSTDGQAYKFLIPGPIYYTVLIFHALCTFVSVPMLYVIIFHIARKHKLEIMKQKNTQSSKNFYRELKATWTIGFVVFLFLLVWLPFLANQFVDFWDIYNGIWDTANSVMVYIAYCNGPANIFVYSIRNREIRQAILKPFLPTSANNDVYPSQNRDYRSSVMC